MADFTFAHREEGFDEHIEKSIRGYSNLLEDVISLSRYFVEDGTNVVDIGCSTGKLTKAMIEYNQDHCSKGRYIGIEIAEGFFKDLEKRADDSEKIAIKRYETYESNIEPVINFYKQSDLLQVVNGEASITEISDEISALIEGMKG